MSDSRGTQQHKISVVANGVQIENWTTYDITVDMTTPADRYSMHIPFRREVWDQLIPDRRITVMIDEVKILTGRLGGRTLPEDEESIEIYGRSLVGRLVDESAPSLNFAGLTMFALIQKVADPWFKTVTFSNARNRRLQRGRGRKAKAGTEPLILKTPKKLGTLIEPGQTRWQVIETLCAQADAMAWGASDGSELIIGQPNYDQEPQFRFFMPAADSRRVAESTVLGMGWREHFEDSYSRVIVVGTGTGTDVNYGARVASRYGEARDNPATPEGTGLAFEEPKRLIAVRSVASVSEAQELAKRELNRRKAHQKGLTVRCAGHGQSIGGAPVTIFAPDTLASVEDERTGDQGIFLITSCNYRSSRSGEETLMTLVPSGTDLTGL